MNKKIAIVNSVFGIGSTGRICSELQTYCNNVGFEAYVFYGRGPKSNKKRGAIKFTLPLSVPFHWAVSRVFDCSGFLSFFSTKILIKKLKKLKPGVIFVNNLHGYYLNIKIFLKYLMNSEAKIFFILHDCWLFTGHCAYFSFQKCDKWKTQCKQCPLKKSYPKSLIFDRSKTNYKIKNRLINNLNEKTTFIVPSRWLANLVKESFLKNFTVSVINNGIDTELFKFRKSYFNKRYLPENKKIILSIANIWDKRKGLNDVMELSKIISDKFIIVLVGKIPSNSKLFKNIIHIQQTSNVEELIDIYSCSDVLFNPSHEDNYPTINLEATACSLPIICYNCCGTHESVDPKFVVNEGDIKSVYNLIMLITNGQIDYDFNHNDFISKNETYKKYLELINNEE